MLACQRIWSRYKSVGARQAAYPVTTAGPKALAGLMQLELMGPVIHMLNVMPRAIANGPNWPQPLYVKAHQHMRALLNRLMLDKCNHDAVFGAADVVTNAPPMLNQARPTAYVGSNCNSLSLDYSQFKPCTTPTSFALSFMLLQCTH